MKLLWSILLILLPIFSIAQSDSSDATIRKTIYPQSERLYYHKNGVVEKRAVRSDSIDSAYIYFDNGCLRVITVDYYMKGFKSYVVEYDSTNCNKVKDTIYGPYNPYKYRPRQRPKDVWEEIRYSVNEPSLQNVQIVDSQHDKEKAPLIGELATTKGSSFRPNDYNKVYNANDEIWQDGEFKDGVLWNGKVYIYDSDGILLKVKIFKNGFYHSEGQL